MNDKSKPALSLVTPQARHHYTRFDQVDQLVGAGEADLEIGYIGTAAGAVQSAAHRPRQTSKEYIKRSNGPYELLYHGCRWRQQASRIGHIPRLLACLGLHRSGADSKP